MTDKKCVWVMGTPCEGEVRDVAIFSKSIMIPMCEAHIAQHRDIMVLHQNKYDIEKVLQDSPENRRKEVLMLKLSGLSIDDVEL